MLRRRRIVRGLVTAVSLAIVTQLGAAQVAWAADGLGKPDIPEPKSAEVHAVKGLGADKARAEVAKERKLNREQAQRAKTEQTALDGPGHMLRSPAGATSSTTTSSGGDGGGDYSATPLSESSSWASGSNSGSFTWSYDFTVPDPAAGPSPDLTLSYDSGSIDGRTGTTNNQGTTVGEGFSLTESYIQRSYGSCEDDGHSSSHDECWKFDNARLVLNGKSSRLVKDGDAWRLSNDDASKVERHTGADNGDADGEYWTVTTSDGTQYVFGKNKLAGASGATDSVWTTPVYGDDSGEPGYSKGSSFSGRSVRQAWRWNLDLVKDTHGNAMSLWYQHETNYYRQNDSETANAAYTRGGYLKEIRYGQRADDLSQAGHRVQYSYSERCTVDDCSSLTESSKDHWPDVPFKALCDKDDSKADCASSGPTFFTRKRLTGITTQSMSDGSFTDVDSWKLTQDYLDPGDIGGTSDQVLTLQSIQRTGKPGDDITLNPISFTYRMLENRVDATDDILPITRPRLSTITTETGAVTTVTYSDPECVRSDVIDAPEDSNTRNCYPQYWHPNGATEASVDWFHKYRVLAVLVTDPTGHNVGVEHSYDYSGAAWHYSDDPFTKKDERTWSDWRGYRKVTEYTGVAKKSKTVSVYYQGMDGDKTDSGSRDVSVTGIDLAGLNVPSVADTDSYSGRLREKITYDGSTPVTVTVNSPWSKETARQSVPDAGDFVARYVRDGSTTTHTYLTATGTWSSRTQSTSYDDYGMASTVDDTGQTGVSGDETCKRTWYARNPSTGLTSLVSRERTVARSCPTGEADLDLPADTGSRGDVLSDTATVYDDSDATAWTAGQQPTTGEATWTGRPTGYPATETGGERNPTGWQTVSTTGYDALGRTTSTTDADGNTSTVSYTPADVGPLTRKGTVNALGQKTWTFYEPLRGQPLRAYDINSKKTEKTFDALGRLTGVWLPNRSRASQMAPSYKFAYHLHNDKPSAVESSTLDIDGETFQTTYTLYDAQLRKIQTQTPAPGGGRVLTDTRYNSRGLAYETYADAFDDTSVPNTTYTQVAQGGAPKQVETTYDGAERPTAKQLISFGTAKWTTHTSYTGDSTATTALDGGSAQRTITDIRGNTIERRDYAGPDPTDPDFGGTAPGTPYTTTAFDYTLDGKQERVTGPDGAEWTYGYDLYGRKTSATDPDSGTTSIDYNALDKPVKATDARGVTLITGYDKLGRPTDTWKNDKTVDNRLTKTVWDTVLKGQKTSTTRYVDGAAYTRTNTEFDTLGHVTTQQLTLPASDPMVKAGAAQTYTSETHYAVNGTLRSQVDPGMGGLQEEAVSYDYNDVGLLNHVSGATGYLLEATYSPTRQLQTTSLGTGAPDRKTTYVTHSYNPATDRLEESKVTDQTHPWMLQDLQYNYDQAGNVTSLADPTTLGGQQAADTQCFTYDGHRRLTHAWTPAGNDCTDTRDEGTLGGRAPYWDSYTYNTAGLRTEHTDHTVGQATTYCYDNDQPHALDATTSAGDCAEPDKQYRYDPTGNTTSRPGQTLTWNTEGNLASVTDGTTKTSYLYDAGGSLLIRDTAGGERVLYVGSTELHLKADGTLWAQRYYTAGASGTVIAVRTNATGTPELSYLAGDAHGTTTLAVKSDADQAFIKRSLAPFGEERTQAAVGAWIDDKGFLGKTADPGTGLTHIGAREYAPTTGTFLSVDPVLAADAPQTLNGYTYSANNPVTHSDPTGECPRDFCQGYGQNPQSRDQWDPDVYHGQGAGAEGDRGLCFTCGSHSNFGDRQDASDLPHASTSPSHLNTASGKSDKKNSEDKAWYESMADGFVSGVKGAWHGVKVAGHWVGDHWRGLAEAGVFVVCVAASAGYCVAAGLAYVAAKHGAAIHNGTFSGKQLAWDLAWTAVGGAIGRGLGGSWRAGPIARGPAGPRPPLWRGVTRPQGAPGAVNWGVTGRDMSVNAGLTFGTCGAGSLSAPLCGVGPK